MPGGKQGQKIKEEIKAIGHNVFINLETSKIYCLPDNYEVVDKTLDDIKFNLKPKYDSQIMTLLSK